VRAASTIALMMNADRTSETSVDIQLRTRQYIPEDCNLDLFLYTLTTLFQLQKLQSIE
jgi:hypothetical protein